jgi:putative flippase GtrA
MIKDLYTKYKEFIAYAFWGVCTTLVNTFVYWILANPFSLAVTPSTVIAWFIAVLFAYLTNRKWVFHSQAHTKSEIAKEIISFYGCRIATGIVDWLCMFIFVELLHFNDLIIKIAANILVILLNYIASKIIIFRKNKAICEIEESI